MTRVLTVDVAEPDDLALAEAVTILAAGGLVAVPTETVYGLAADATNPVAAARIFAAKGRPTINPLIVHVNDVAMAQRCVADWPETAAALADAFWPGPLTLLLPRSSLIPDVVTAGLGTVGIRVPATRVVRRLIAALDRPLAAPSANRSTGISPTTAAHVRKDLAGRIDLILDAGPAEVGLESTVLDLTSDPPRILRPGPISEADIVEVLGRRLGVASTGQDPAAPHPSPGQMLVHYAPHTEAIRIEPDQWAGFSWPESAALLVVGQPDLPGPDGPVRRRIDLDEPETAMRGLYAALHELDALGVSTIVVIPPPDRPEWQAIRDRLSRATRPLRE